MGRGSQILIGVILLLLAAVLAIMAMIPGEQAFLAFRLIGAILSGVLGFVCVFTWGRPYTTRVALGLLSLTMICAFLGILFSDISNLKAAGFAGVIALISGTYAVTGFYPESLPLSQVFSNQNPEKPDNK